MKPALIRAAGVAFAGAAAVTLVATAAPASAAPALTVVYDANGTSLVKKPNSTVTLGPTTLTVGINGDGSFSGDLPIPPTVSQFKVIGLLPARATVSFVPAGPVTGQLTSGGGGSRVSSVAHYYLKLTNVTLGGLPTFVGQRCQTKDPVEIPASTPAGEFFNVTQGGHLTGTYTIGKFANCGLTTGVINLLVPGSGNTLDLTLSGGRLAS